MKFTAFAIGSMGDVQPFIFLGKELKKRGHEFSIATFYDYKKSIEEAGLKYKLIEGNVEIMMRTLLSERKNSKKSSGINGLKKVLKSNPNLYENLNNACENTDVIIYMQFGAIAYHFAEKRNIQCIRTFVFPSDPTSMYSAMMPMVPRNTAKCKRTYKMVDLCMNAGSIQQVNQWRKKLKLKKWHYWSSYKKIYKKPILTLYQYSEHIVPRDPKWKSNIYITGPWEDNKEEKFIPDKRLEEFLRNGEPPIFIGFGSMIYSKMPEVQKMILEALKKSGQRAILGSGWSKFEEEHSSENVFYIDYVPYKWLFKYVKAVVHHGGAGTTHLGLKMGKPTLILPFGADQMFWGKQIEFLNLGPEPISIKNPELTSDVLAKKLLELNNKEYEKNAKIISKKLQKEDGVRYACDIIEKEIL